jgi:hypothetical protein
VSRLRTMDNINWLLDSDPAIRWQAMRVPREGVGAEILVRQGSDGSWHRAGARRLACNLQALREGRNNKANQSNRKEAQHEMCSAESILTNTYK